MSSKKKYRTPRETHLPALSPHQLPIQQPKSRRTHSQDSADYDGDDEKFVSKKKYQYHQQSIVPSKRLQTPTNLPALTNIKNEKERLLLKKELQSMKIELGFKIYDDNNNDGVRVTEIVTNSSASTAGMMVDDKIMHLGGTPCFNRIDFETILSKITPGEHLIVKVLRSGRIYVLVLEVGARGIPIDEVRTLKNLIDSVPLSVPSSPNVHPVVQPTAPNIPSPAKHRQFRKFIEEEEPEPERKPKKKSSTSKPTEIIIDHPSDSEIESPRRTSIILNSKRTETNTPTKINGHTTSNGHYTHSSRSPKTKLLSSHQQSDTELSDNDNESYLTFPKKNTKTERGSFASLKNQPLTDPDSSLASWQENKKNIIELKRSKSMSTIELELDEQRALDEIENKKRFEQKQKEIQDAKKKLQKAKMYIGIEITDGSPTNSSNVRIIEVKKNSTSVIGGLKEHDLIEQVNGIVVRSRVEFGRVMKTLQIGDTVPFTILRNNKLIIKYIKIGALEFTNEQISELRRIANSEYDVSNAIKEYINRKGEEKIERTDIKIEKEFVKRIQNFVEKTEVKIETKRKRIAVNAALEKYNKLKTYLGLEIIDHKNQAVKVSNVTKHKAAYVAGIREHDLIESVNGQPTRNRHEFEILFKGNNKIRPGDSVIFVILRSDRTNGKSPRTSRESEKCELIVQAGAINFTIDEIVQLKQQIKIFEDEEKEFEAAELAEKEQYENEKLLAKRKKHQKMTSVVPESFESSDNENEDPREAARVRQQRRRTARHMTELKHPVVQETDQDENEHIY